MKTDVALPYIHSYNREIIYCLRSLQKHFLPLGDIYIIGDKPDYLKDFIHIPFRDGHIKNLNIFNKILEVCKTDISEDFLMVNDDHYLLQDVTHFPNYYNGTIQEAIGRATGKYKSALVSTCKKLIEQRLPTLHYDIHTPMIYNKEKFVQLEYSGVVKSLYGNTFPERPVYRKDFKAKDTMLIWNKLEGLDSFSTGAWSEPLQIFLENLFPERSRYEK